MCGLNGFNRQDEALLRRMNESISYRGPDFSGVYFDEQISMGHLLLSIREKKELSQQPYMDNPEWILLFNGQIFNTNELKKNLDSIDKERSDLDTHILYQSILQHKWEFISKIQGMFAIALYNSKEKVVRLYRDPSGQKHIYYYYKDGEFIFSSEIKSILQHNNVDKSVDEEAVLVATSLGYIPGEKTIFKFIHKVAPSQEITFNLNKKGIENSFYKSGSPKYFQGDFSEAIEQLVNEHLQSKEKVALNLSGGLDSSILLHEMSRVGHDIDTYSTIFDGANPKYNTDAQLAQKLARDYKTRHHEILVTKDSYLNRLLKAYALIEEPNFNISLPAYLQTAETEGIHGDKNRVILSGNGGDEIFGGYPHYWQSARMENQIRILTPLGFNLIKNYRNKTNFNYHDINERWLSYRLFNYRNKSKDKFVISYIKESMYMLETLYGLKDGDVYATMLRDRFLWMPGENFVQADKLYMSQSIELRSPFSYHPFRLYADSKLKKEDYINENSNKLFLRNLYRNKLPAYITERTDKTGWRSPLVDWYDDSFKNKFLEIIGDKSDTRLIKWSEIRRIIGEGDKWPGKHIHLYLSLAILSNMYNIEL